MDKFENIILNLAYAAVLIYYLVIRDIQLSCKYIWVYIVLGLVILGLVLFLIPNKKSDAVAYKDIAKQPSNKLLWFGAINVYRIIQILFYSISIGIPLIGMSLGNLPLIFNYILCIVIGLQIASYFIYNSIMYLKTHQAPVPDDKTNGGEDTHN